MDSLATSAASGRAASIARRQALAQGKAALPPSAERVRVGVREAARPAAPAPAAPAAATAPTPMAAVPAASAAPSAVAAAAPSLAGRLMSMLRRKQLSGGKLAPPPRDEAPAAPAACDGASGSCREAARERRRQQSLRGRGDAPAAPASRPPRQGRLEYAPKVVASPTQGAQTVTGLRIGRGAQVTGDEAGAALPVSGTQYIAGDQPGARAAAPKVGQMRTASGLVVSGSLVRSRVAITGDEPGAGVTITGEADPTPDDDLTPRDADHAPVAAQFQRQANPHGHSVFGTNLGRSVRSIGSRQRDGAKPLESTQGGQAITGSAIGRSARVTGDELGACRTVTGDQYLTPAHAQAECGNRGDGNGGGTAPAGFVGASRRDPVTGAKVTASLTWGAQRVTGPDLEHRPGITGDEPGVCRVITGTPYQGQGSAYGWCDTGVGDEAAARLSRRRSNVVVTGDTPVAPARVTGDARGQARELTGTPYTAAAEAPARRDAPPALAAIAQQFSVSQPQRQAQLAAAGKAQPRRITGSFALGHDKITGNVEFGFPLRQRRNGEPERPSISGEGSTGGPIVTGDAWAPTPAVTGTEGPFAAGRNPSERAGKPHAFAGAGLFKGKGHHDEPRQIVTGMVGWTAKSAAKVTLSGGAQG